MTYGNVTISVAQFEGARLDRHAMKRCPLCLFLLFVPLFATSLAHSQGVGWPRF